MKTYIKREYVNVGKYNVEKDYSALSIDKTLHSIRFYQDYLIYNSNAQKLTNKINYGKNYQKSQKDYKKHFSTNPSYSFMNQDIMSNDDLPFIGPVNKKNKNLYLATAYQAWGMTNGVLAARVLADNIEGKRNPYQNLFDPSRMNVTLFVNSFFSSFGYLKAYFLSLFKISSNLCSFFLITFIFILIPS